MARTFWVGLVLVCVAGAVACGGDDDEVDIGGLSDTEASEEVAEAFCERQARCGEPSVECDQESCTGTIEPIDYDECYNEFQPDILGDLQCVELTEAQQATLNSCVNGIVSLPCVTQAELDAFVDAINRGEDPEPPGDEVAACEQVDEIFDGCEDE